MTSAMEHAPVTYRGMVNRWHIDDMGHMNVRYYVDKAEQAQRAYLAHIGLGASQRAALQLRPVTHDNHLRFLSECHSGTSLFARTAPVDLTETRLRLCTEICRTVDGAVSATMTSDITFQREDGPDVPLLEEALAIAQADLVDQPPYAAPKGIPGPKPTQVPNLETALARHLIETARFEAKPEYFNSDGRIESYRLLGGLLEGIPTLFSAMQVDRAARAKDGIGGAALEYWLCRFNEPKPGDVLFVMGGLSNVGSKTFTHAYWVFDDRGNPIASVEAIAVTFDLKARKAMEIPAEARANYEAMVKPGHGI